MALGFPYLAMPADAFSLGFPALQFERLQLSQVSWRLCDVVRGCPKGLGERTFLVVSMCQVDWSLGRSRKHGALYGLLQVSSGLMSAKNWLCIRSPALGRGCSREVLHT